MHRLLVVAAVAAAFFAAQAQASSPPSRVVAVTPTSIDGATFGGAPRGVFATRADARYRDRGFRLTGDLWWRGKATRKTLAAKQKIWAAQFLDRNGKIFLIEYWGPFRTEKGDRLGTTLATFRAHWPNAKVVSAAGLGKKRIRAMRGSNAVITTGKVTAIFGFDRAKRLRGVMIGGRRELSNFQKVCVYAPLCRQR